MAFAMMRFGKTSRNYEAVSRQISQALSGAGNPMFGRTLSDVHKAKIKGEKHGMFGRNKYDVWVERYGQATADKKLAEHKAKRSTIMSGSGNSMFGKKHTAERNKAHSATLTGRKYMWKNGQQKRIRPENFDTMLADGWSFTRPDRNSPS